MRAFKDLPIDRPILPPPSAYPVLPAPLFFDEETLPEWETAILSVSNVLDLYDTPLFLGACCELNSLGARIGNAILRKMAYDIIVDHVSVSSFDTIARFARQDIPALLNPWKQKFVPPR